MSKDEASRAGNDEGCQGWADEWARLCNLAGWGEPEQVIHLEGFIVEKGLARDFLAYAAAAAESEEKEADVVRQEMEGGLDLVVSFDSEDQVTCVHTADTGDAVSMEDVDSEKLHRGLALRLEVTYPRATRHGVPDEATHDGGVKWARDRGYLVDDAFDVWPTDSGDDSCMVLSLMIRVSRDTVRSTV